MWFDRIQIFCVSLQSPPIGSKVANVQHLHIGKKLEVGDDLKEVFSVPLHSSLEFGPAHFGFRADITCRYEALGDA